MPLRTPLTPRPDRSTLQFPEAVIAAFSFLETDYRFHRTSTQPTFVRYESDSVFVNVYHGRSSYELAVEVGPRGVSVGEEAGFSLSELVRVTDPKAAVSFHNPQVTTREGVQEFVPELAKLVRRYAERALRGDPQSFKQLSIEREHRSQNFTLEVRASQIRPKAEAAFRVKDYKKAASLYESIRGVLSPAELSKLLYAKRLSKNAPR